MWEIYAYQNSASLLGIFNAAAAIHASGDYLSALAAVTFCGFVAALVAYAFAPEKLQGWQWLATVTLVFSVLILPKTTVGIVDKIGSEGVQVVDNVPLGMAALGSLTSTIGHTLTGLFETSFQTIPGRGALPAELSYQNNGLMFGNRLIREASALVIQDPAMRADMVNFVQNCTYYDLLDGSLDPTAFSSSSNVWPLMANPNPARFTTMTRGGWNVEIETCASAYVNLDDRLVGHTYRMLRKLGATLNPTIAAETVIIGQIQQAYFKNGIADASATAADMIRQNAMINMIADSGKLVAQRSNDPAAMVLALGRAQATAQQNATWINYGKVAEQALPVFRNVVEALTYALFPLVVLLLLVTSGRESVMVLKGYVLTLIWIQLWPPLYAVLNYMATVYAAYDLAAAANHGNGTVGLTLQTASVIYSRAISGEAVVGYLAFSVPLLAWAVVKRMEGMGSAMVGGLSGLQASLGSATAGAAIGNISLANVSMDQMSLAPNRTSAFMGSWQNDLSGNTISANALTGRTAVSLLRNQGFASRVVSAKVSESDVQDATRQVEAARSEAVAANTERATVLAEAFTKGLAKTRSSSNTTGSASSSFEQLGANLNRLDQISKSIASTTGLSQAQVARIGFSASGRLGLTTPIVQAQGGASAEKAYSAGLSQDDQRALASMTSEQVSEFKQFADRTSQDKSFATSVSNDARETADLSTRLAATLARSERADASYSERSTFSNRVSNAYERGELISIDIAQDPRNLEMFSRYADQYGSNSKSALVLLGSELARNSLAPTQVTAAGTALPASFADIATIHSRNRLDVAAAEVDAQYSQNQKIVHQSRGKATSRDPSVEPSGVRASIQTEGNRVRSAAASGRETFDRKAGIVAAHDGTLGTNRSLVVEAGRQVGNDAASIASAVKEAATNALRK